MDTAIAVVGLEKRTQKVRGRRRPFIHRRTGRGVRVARAERGGEDETVEVLRGTGLPSRHGPGPRPRPVARGAACDRLGVMLQSGGAVSRPAPLGTAPPLRRVPRRSGRSPEAVLDRVGLEAGQRTPVRRLSGGQQQRLSLACAVIGKPEVLFLDEPTAGMDPHARATTWQLVAHHRRPAARP